MSTAKSGPRDRPAAERFRRPASAPAAPACTSTRCRHRRPAARPASSAGRLCPSCLNRLGSDLRKLADAYRESDHALTPAAPRPRVRVSGNRTAKGIVLDEKTLALRTRVAQTLTSWARLVVDETDSPRPQECEVPTLIRFLTHHINWLAGHPAAADFDDEISRLLESCNTVLGPGQARHTPVGNCPEPGCTSTLSLSHPDPSRPARHIICESGHTLSPRQWLHLMSSPHTHNSPLPLIPEGTPS